MLPVPRGAVRTRPASHEVPSRALGNVVGRARHDARGTLVDDAVSRRRERVHALADLPRAPGEVGVPHGREGVRVLPLGSIVRVRYAGVLPHVYTQRPVGGGGDVRPERDGRLAPCDVPRPRRRPRLIRVLPGDVKVEGRVQLVRAERVGTRVAAASAAERLARLPAIHRRRRRELLLGGHQARVRAPFRLDHPPVRGGLVGADVSGRARPAIYPGPPRGARLRPGRIRHAVRAVGGVRAVHRPRHRAVLARRIVVIVRVLALCGEAGRDEGIDGGQRRCGPGASFRARVRFSSSLP